MFYGLLCFDFEGGLLDSGVLFYVYFLFTCL